jgi:hypothetical protein
MYITLNIADVYRIGAATAMAKPSPPAQHIAAQRPLDHVQNVVRVRLEERLGRV